MGGAEKTVGGKMGKNTSYEVLVIASTALSDDEIAKQIGDVEKTVKKNNGSVKKTEKWGRKKLAYEIKHFNEGYYFLTYFTGQSQTVAELDRVLKINDNIIRHMIVRDERG